MDSNDCDKLVQSLFVKDCYDGKKLNKYGLLIAIFASVSLAINIVRHIQLIVRDKNGR